MRQVSYDRIFTAAQLDIAPGERIAVIGPTARGRLRQAVAQLCKALEETPAR